MSKQNERFSADGRAEITATAAACDAGAYLLYRPSCDGRLCPSDPGIGGSSNGRTADSDSACLGSNPSPPARFFHYISKTTRRKFDVLKAWAVDRLGRSLQDLVVTLNDLKASGVHLFLHQ